MASFKSERKLRPEKFFENVMLIEDYKNVVKNDNQDKADLEIIEKVFRYYCYLGISLVLLCNLSRKITEEKAFVPTIKTLDIGQSSI